MKQKHKNDLQGQEPNPKRIWEEIEEREIDTFAEFICMEHGEDATCIEEKIITEVRDGRIIRRTIRRKK